MAAFPVSCLPQPDQLAAGAERLVAGLRDCERGELVTALEPGQVAGVVGRQAAQCGQGQPALVAQRAELRTEAVDRGPVRGQDSPLPSHQPLP